MQQGEYEADQRPKWIAGRGAEPGFSAKFRDAGSIPLTDGIRQERSNSARPRFLNRMEIEATRARLVVMMASVYWSW